MPTADTPHCTEEQLMELALHSRAPELRRHVDACPQCAAALAEFSEVKRHIEQSEDEDVPSGLEARIMSISHGGHGHPQGIAGVFHALISSPLLLAVVIMIMVIIAWLLVGSEILKAP